ncbi:peptide ABC transporter substrate-binding protein [Fusibacter sp. 3D3]|uniref:peptide ABC transporter substrate-binding protein n=1 Tax=Fusibacter sp. 3D3 TaxID=1048380 RepID=UPI000853369C|nr:peptide ABC transporter substrate-binding protein [Fusibacter sp. 3D3]GAU76272.1 oligopeptide ABC transporter periplasmic oligopeptide-binding protein OppA [Fusibacter sp. 3D3]
MKKILSLSMMIVLMISLFTGCTSSSDEKPAVTSNTSTNTDTEATSEGSNAAGSLAAMQEFTFASANDMMTLDVSKMNDEMSALIMYAVNEPLVRYYKGEVTMASAESYEVSEDGTKVIFHLRDLKWSDGEPVTAGDFEYAFKRLLNPETGSSQCDIFDRVSGAIAYYSGENADAESVGIKATDDKTLEMTLTQADPFFIEHIAEGINFYPLRKDYVGKYAEGYGSGAESFIGCGPFILSEWVQGASITLEKNENYWDADKIKLTKVTELIVGDENTRVGMYDLGDVDELYSISKTQTLNYPDYGSKSGGTLQHLVYMSSEGSLLSNKNLRLALSHSIDRQAIVTALSAPGTEVTDRMIDPTSTLNGESIAEKYPASTGIPANGDVEKAKAYLNDALAEMNLSSVADLQTINYVCLDSSSHKAYAEALQARWADTLGVDVEINIMPVPQAIGALLSGEFDIFLNGMGTGVSPDTLLSNYTFDGANNYAKWNNQAYSDLIEAQFIETDINKRLETLQKAEQLFLNESPVTPLWLPGTAYICKDYVQDLTYGRQTGSIEFIYASILEH